MLQTMTDSGVFWSKVSFSTSVLSELPRVCPWPGLSAGAFCLKGLSLSLCSLCRVKSLSLYAVFVPQCRRYATRRSLRSWGPAF